VIRIIGKGILFGVSAFVGYVGGVLITGGLAAVAGAMSLDSWDGYLEAIEDERARQRREREPMTDAPFNMIRSFPIPEGSPLASPAGFLRGVDLPSFVTAAERSYADEETGDAAID